MFDINERIIELRRERHWSEYQLAEKSGIGQSTISSWTRTKIYAHCPKSGENLQRFRNHTFPVFCRQRRTHGFSFPCTAGNASQF